MLRMTAMVIICLYSDTKLLILSHNKQQLQSSAMRSTKHTTGNVHLQLFFLNFAIQQIEEMEMVQVTPLRKTLVSPL